MTALRDLSDRWRTEAALLDRRGASGHAAALRTCAEELDQHIAAWEAERLPVKDAAAESGYSPAQLRRLFPRQRAIARKDLPRKATGQGPELAARVLRGQG